MGRRQDLVSICSFSCRPCLSYPLRRQQLNLGVTLRAKALTTIPDSTSQKFLLMGSLNRDSSTDEGKHVMVFLDFLPMKKRQCQESDFEKWYARTASGTECLMGHKQWYRRRKEDADCFVGHKFEDPVEHEDNCSCTDEDYEWYVGRLARRLTWRLIRRSSSDYNYVKQGDKCVSVGPEPIPAGVCPQNRQGTYSGSSGYRKIPGNTCIAPSRGAKDEKVEKDCAKGMVLSLNEFCSVSNRHRFSTTSGWSGYPSDCEHSPLANACVKSVNTALDSF